MMITRFLVFNFIFLYQIYGIDFSLRMKALGTDFAYLIPDYETDVYQNPQIIGKKLTGISFEPDLNTPLTMRVLFKRFGICGMYWGSYHSDKQPYYGLADYKYFRINDLWMLDMRGKVWRFLGDEVWNWYNDLYYYVYNRSRNADDYDYERSVEYLFSGSTANKLSQHITFQYRLCGGLLNQYERMKYYSYENIYEHWLILVSGRLGLFYRNAEVPNHFTSWFAEIGGPVTNSEIDTLPYSVFSDLFQNYSDSRITYFAKAFIGKIGWATAIPIEDNSFVAIGCREYFLFQRTNKADTNIELSGIMNTLSIPFALEYVINKISLRAGIKLCYNINKKCEWNTDSTLVSNAEHSLNFDYSFGLSWRIAERWIIDLYNVSDISSVKSWAIYVKYF